LRTGRGGMAGSPLATAMAAFGSATRPLRVSNENVGVGLLADPLDNRSRDRVAGPVRVEYYHAHISYTKTG
jgi:hypothetical protein